MTSALIDLKSSCKLGTRVPKQYTTRHTGISACRYAEACTVLPRIDVCTIYMKVLSAYGQAKLGKLQFFR